MKLTVLILLLAYVPLFIILAYLTDYWRRNRKSEKTKERVYLDLSERLPEKPRMLSDESPDNCEFEDLKEKLLDLFEREKIFLNPDIRIHEVASRLYTNKTYLSKVIRLKTNKNFCQLVHFYRVREAIRLYADNPDLTISQLGKMVGFNSMTTFNTAFGRNTGYTPAEWCKEYRKTMRNGEQNGRKRQIA